jgi:glycerophosphoryl diester phosphodiesterase
VSRPSLSRDRTTQPDQVEIIAHRGTPREYPENSLPGFHRALELGASGIELDVHLTADGVVVVHHDPALHMTPVDPGPPPRIRELTAAELRRHVLAPGVPIPTLSEALDVVAGRATVYVEIKAPQAEPVVLRSIASTATRCAIHGFDHRVALRVAQTTAAQANGGAVPTGILSASYLIDPVGALHAARARDYWQQWELIDEDLVSQIHDAGGRVIAWTVNAVSDARRLRDIGVDAICTDVCGELVAARIGQ